MRKSALAGAVLALALVHCTPDFDSLSSGAGGSSGSAGSSQDGGGSTGAQGGSTPGGSTTAGNGTGATSTGAGGTDGVEPVGAAGGTGAGGAESAAGASGAAGAAGEGGAGECPFPHSGATSFDGFDGGLSGPGFADALTTTAADTTHGLQVASQWDELVGKTCPGSLKLVAQFKAYASGTEDDEKAIVDLRFTSADWSGAKALHAWFKVDPGTAPLFGLRFFVLSGSSFLFRQVFEYSSFNKGTWIELVMPLQAGADYDPTSVYRLGVQAVLKRAESSGLPAVPPTVTVWMDDVWVEK